MEMLYIVNDIQGLSKSHILLKLVKWYQITNSTIIIQWM